VRNTGRQTWNREEPVEVRTFGHRASAHFHPSWMAPNRVCQLVEAQVRPGETGTFWFKAAPALPGEAETFQLFCWNGTGPREEGIWLPNTQFGIAPESDSAGPIRGHDGWGDTSRPTCGSRLIGALHSGKELFAGFLGRNSRPVKEEVFMTGPL